jgi:peroxiredoxin
MSNGAAPAGSSCPADLAPTTSLIQIPGTVDLEQTITVTLIDGVYGVSVALPAP